MKRFDYENPILEVIFLSENIVRTSNIGEGEDPDAGEDYW